MPNTSTSICIASIYTWSLSLEFSLSNTWLSDKMNFFLKSLSSAVSGFFLFLPFPPFFKYHTYFNICLADISIRYKSYI